jgi:hypothetical protein
LGSFGSPCSFCDLEHLLTVGASLLAMVVNDNALIQSPRGALQFFAS